MDIPKILTAICGFLLIVCLVLSVTALTSLRHAIDETDALKTSASAILRRLNGYVETLENTEDEDSIPTVAPDDGHAKNGYCIRSVGKKIGIYTADGALIQLIDVDAATLPPAEREALKDGITVHSWQEMLALLTDYTT